jgi:hypothetical protein
MKTTHTQNFAAAALIGILALAALPASAQQKKPNILIIWEDDIA